MSTSAVPTPLFSGEDAYRSSAPGARESRVAQLQTLSIQALGDRSQIASVREDASLIGVPPIRFEYGDIPRSLMAAGPLDKYTYDTLDQTAGPSWAPGNPASINDLLYIRRLILERGQSRDLAVLLNLSLASASEVERVSAAQALDALSAGNNWRANEILADSVSSTSLEAAAIGTIASPARVSPQPPTSFESGTPFDPYRRLSVIEEDPKSASVAIHGTWARISSERWYAPRTPLHEHIAEAASPDLYIRDDYPRWSGGYSSIERTAGVKALERWLAERANFISQFDTVYAHSHGGNVALTAAANGVKMQLLVLLHVPPRARTDAEWKAIRRNVERVVVYRTRPDCVVLADMIRAHREEGEPRTSRQSFDNELLPHVDTPPHPLRGPWFSHGYFTRLETWTSLDLAGDIRFYRGSAGPLGA